MNANMPESVRLFYALWPDDDTRMALTQIQGFMQGRKTAYENLHITLAFLGQQPVHAVSVLKDILMHLEPREITLTLDKVGYFTKNRIAWAGMHEVPAALLECQREVTAALGMHGISYDAHASFKPHVTLAREASLPADMVFNPIQWKASQVVLVQSITAGPGPTYKVLASRSLDERIWATDQEPEQ